LLDDSSCASRARRGDSNFPFSLFLSPALDLPGAFSSFPLSFSPHYPLGLRGGLVSGKCREVVFFLASLLVRRRVRSLTGLKGECYFSRSRSFRFLFLPPRLSSRCCILNKDAAIASSNFFPSPLLSIFGLSFQSSFLSLSFGALRKVFRRFDKGDPLHVPLLLSGCLNTNFQLQLAIWFRSAPRFSLAPMSGVASPISLVLCFPACFVMRCARIVWKIPPCARVLSPFRPAMTHTRPFPTPE